MDFERQAMRHKDAIYRQLVRLCGNHDDAEDALVAALLKAHQTNARLRDPEAFQAWLSIIARRACLRIKRNEGAHPLAPLLEETVVATASTERVVDERMMHDCIAETIETLPPQYRRAYVGFEIEGLSGKDLAAELGISVGAFKSRLLRARKLVRERLDAAMCFSS